MKSIFFIWLIFVCLFGYQAIWHYKKVGKSFPLFTTEGGKVAAINGIQTTENAFRKFVVDVNEYIKNYNESSSSQNKMAASGYFLAALTALFSAWLELKAYKRRKEESSV